MILEKVRSILFVDDGSLPEINFHFGLARVADRAYAVIQARATGLAAEHAYYWSTSADRKVPIYFGDNPALANVSGDAKAFHVLFSGLR